MGSKFKTVKVKNDWMYLTYTWGEFELDEKQGGTCDFKWSDGTIERGVKFISETRNTSYSDHGHHCDVQQRRLLLLIDFHGTTMRMAIEKVKTANIVQLMPE